jgi:LysM repeat protein
VLDRSRVDTLKGQPSNLNLVVNAEKTDSVSDSTATSASDTNTIGLDKSCNCVYHVVQPGDTLWSIARNQGVTIDKLKADNKEIQDRPIRVGDIIKILM